MDRAQPEHLSVLVCADAPASTHGLPDNFAEALCFTNLRVCDNFSKALRFSNLRVCDSAAKKVWPAVRALLKDNHMEKDQTGEMYSPGSRCAPPANRELEFPVVMSVGQNRLAADAPGPHGSDDDAAARARCFLRATALSCFY